MEKFPKPKSEGGEKEKETEKPDEKYSDFETQFDKLGLFGGQARVVSKHEKQGNYKEEKRNPIQERRKAVYKGEKSIRVSEPEKEEIKNEPEEIESGPAPLEAPETEQKAPEMKIEESGPVDLEKELNQLDIKESAELLKEFIPNEKEKIKTLNPADLREELFRISSMENILDQKLFGTSLDDEDCKNLYEELRNLKDLNHEARDEYDRKTPEEKELKTETAEEKTETKEKEKKYEYEWEKQAEIWMDEKIKTRVEREMDKMKKRGETENRELAETRVRENIQRVLARIFKNFAVHKTGLEDNRRFTDLDGRVCLGLMEFVGWDMKSKDKNVAFIDYSERLENTVHLDVGQYDGVAFLQKTDEGLQELDFSDKEGLESRKKDKNFFFNLGMIIDHHPEGTPSASSMLSRLLYRLGLFREYSKEDIKKIGNMVRFVDLIDSRGFQEVGKPENWNKSDRTIMGLCRNMQFESLRKFFREDGDFDKVLTDKELRHYGLIQKRKGKVVNFQENQKDIIDKSYQKLEEFKNNGFIIETDKYGKIALDITVDGHNEEGKYIGQKGQIPGGAFAAQSVGCSYLKWDRKDNTLFMFSDQELNKDLFDKGTRIRKHLWILQKGKEDTGLTLNKVIEKIGGKVMPGSELEKYLIEEKEKPEEPKEEPKQEKEEKTTVEEPSKKKEEKPLSKSEEIDQKISQKKEEIEKVEAKMSIYRPLGWFRRKPAVRDLGYYAAESELKELGKDLVDLKLEKKTEAVIEKLQEISEKKAEGGPGISYLEGKEKKLEKEKRKLEKLRKKLKKKK